MVILLIMGLAAFLRGWGVRYIANDHDECVYLSASQKYASLMLALDLKNLVYFSENYEHPAFAKLVYALGMLGARLEPMSCDYFRDDVTTYEPARALQQRARALAAFFGVLAVGLLACIHPLAGLFLATHTFAVQFTSVVYLEALPALASLICVWAYERGIGSATGEVPGGGRGERRGEGPLSPALPPLEFRGGHPPQKWGLGGFLRRKASQKSPNISPAQGRLGAKTLFSAACSPLNPLEWGKRAEGTGQSGGLGRNNRWLSQKNRWLSQKNRWLWLSALGLGLATASKYMYAAAGVAVMVHALWTTARQPGARAKRLAKLAGWGLLAVAVFFLADPYLWVKTPSRLYKSLTFCFEYSDSENVAKFNYPAWQALMWLTRPVADHPYKAIPSVEGSFWVEPDVWIAVLVPLGLLRLMRKRGVYAVWLMLGLGFLLVWHTKWPQYVMILLAPWCLAAGEGLQAMIEIVRKVMKKTRLFTARG